MNTRGYTADKFITVAFRSNVADDMRGRQDHSYCSTTSADHAFMEEHILSYEPGISHYRREHAPNVLYVDPSLKKIDMYESYKMKCNESNRKCKSQTTYSNKINEMQISFAKLGHEECEVCIEFDEHTCPSDALLCDCDCCQHEKEKQPCACCKAFTVSEQKKKSKKIPHLSSAKMKSLSSVTAVKLTSRYKKNRRK